MLDNHWSIAEHVIGCFVIDKDIFYSDSILLCDRLGHILFRLTLVLRENV